MRPRGDEAAYDLFELHGGTPSAIDDSLPAWARLYPDPEPVSAPTRLLLDLMTDSDGIIHYREIDRANQQHKKHRADAREAARRSEDPAVRTALRMAEGGFGVVDIINKTRVEASLVRLLVLGKSS